MIVRGVGRIVAAVAVLGAALAVTMVAGPPGVARADGHGVVATIEGVCVDGHTELTWSVTAWAGDGTPESRTNGAVVIGVRKTNLGEFIVAPHVAQLVAPDFAVGGTVQLPGDYVGEVEVLAFPGVWGDGYDGESLDDVTESVDLDAVCEVAPTPPRLGFFVVPPSPMCVSGAMAVRWALTSDPSATDEARTNRQILLTVDGPGVYVEPTLVELTPANNFIAVVGGDLGMVVAGDAVGTLTITATVLAPWGDGRPAGETVTNTMELPLASPSCAHSDLDHRAVLTTSVRCTADGYQVDWTATAWNSPTATDEARTHPAVTVYTGTLSTFDTDPFIGEFSMENGFTFSGSTTVPGNTVGLFVVAVETAMGGPWGDGQPTPPDDGSNLDGFFLLIFAGRCVPPPAPTAAVAAAGDGEAVVSWTAPALPPTALPLTGYTVTASPGNATCTTGGATSCTVSGLTNGTAYTFGVVATSEVGDSPPSMSEPVTPSAPPSVAVTAAGGQGAATNQQPIRFRVAFDQAVDDFDEDDVEVQGAATVTVTPEVSGLALAAPTAFTVEVSGVAAEGVVSVRVRAGAVTNANGQTNAASDWFGIDYDTTAPVLSLPGTVQVVAAPGATGASATWPVEALGAASVTCAPAAGTVFPVGTTTVTCEAVDLAGNSTTGSFSVVVAASQAPDTAAPGSADPSTPGSSPTVGELPATGDDHRGMLAVAAAILVAGLALLVLTRRSRRSTPPA